MKELIDKKTIERIVDNAGYSSGRRFDEPMGETQIKQLITEILYQTVNAIDKEVLRNLLG